MLFKREEIDFDALLDILQTSSGMMEAVIGVLCIFIAFHLARFTFKHVFAHAPERYERFLPYVGFRLVLPVAAQALVLLSRSAWVHLLHERAMILHLLSAMLFWLTLIRLCCAVVRQALPRAVSNATPSISWPRRCGWVSSAGPSASTWW